MYRYARILTSMNVDIYACTHTHVHIENIGV